MVLFFRKRHRLHAKFGRGQKLFLRRVHKYLPGHSLLPVEYNHGRGRTVARMLNGVEVHRIDDRNIAAAENRYRLQPAAGALIVGRDTVPYKHPSFVKGYQLSPKVRSCRRYFLGRAGQKIQPFTKFPTTPLDPSGMRFNGFRHEVI
jgi:hypothetical protein